MPEIRFWYHLPVKVSVQHTLSCAEKAERVGFDVVSHMDHFLYISEKLGCIPECWTMLTAVAAKTGLEVASLVMCSLFRNPALLAKMVATLDQVSQGRVHLGIGAGWWEEEFRAYGYPWPSSKMRVDETIEAVDIIKKLWTEEEVNYEGMFWKIKGCKLSPRTYRDPHPPIWNGGSGPRMLRMAGELCDGWVSGGEDPEAVRKSMEIVLDAAGDRDIQFANYFTVGEGKLGFEEAADRIEALVSIGVTNFIIILMPDPSNLEMLDRCGDLLRRFR